MRAIDNLERQKSKKIWTHGELNPGPFTCEAKIIPLDHAPNRACAVVEGKRIIEICKRYDTDTHPLRGKRPSQTFQLVQKADWTRYTLPMIRTIDK